MLRHTTGTAQVIPILLRPVDWQGSSFEGLHVLPGNKLPVVNWRSHDEAFMQIAQGIRLVAEDILLERRTPKPDINYREKRE